MSTPRTWPDNAWPTPQQLAEWLAVCTPEERWEWAERAIRDAQTAHRCFVANHDGALDELHRVRAAYARLCVDQGSLRVTTPGTQVEALTKAHSESRSNDA